jgi:hypothetical protein
MSQKDGSLTFTLYGKVADIEKAKKSLKTAFTHAVCEAAIQGGMCSCIWYKRCVLFYDVW